MQMNKEQIMEIIPHRDPFLLIDEIEEIEEGKRVVAYKHIKADDFWFKGHCPEYPVVPGVLILEMLAQAGAVAMLMMPENKGKIGFFGHARGAVAKRNNSSDSHGNQANRESQINVRVFFKPFFQFEDLFP